MASVDNKRSSKFTNLIKPIKRLFVKHKHVTGDNNSEELSIKINEGEKRMTIRELNDRSIIGCCASSTLMSINKLKSKFYHNLMNNSATTGERPGNADYSINDLPTDENDDKESQDIIKSDTECLANSLVDCASPGPPSNMRYCAEVPKDQFASIETSTLDVISGMVEKTEEGINCSRMEVLDSADIIDVSDLIMKNEFGEGILGLNCSKIYDTSDFNVQNDECVNNQRDDVIDTEDDIKFTSSSGSNEEYVLSRKERRSNVKLNKIRATRISDPNIKELFISVTSEICDAQMDTLAIIMKELNRVIKEREALKDKLKMNNHILKNTRRKVNILLGQSNMRHLKVFNTRTATKRACNVTQ